MSRDALQNLRKLPRVAYGMLNEQTVTIARGAPEAIPVCIPPSLIDSMNARNGVTRYQRLAMEAGVAFGWTSTAADPDYHAQNNNEQPKPKRLYRVVMPLAIDFEVQAQDEAEALDEAARMFEALNFKHPVRPDGVPSIIDEVIIS